MVARSVSEASNVEVEVDSAHFAYAAGFDFRFKMRKLFITCSAGLQFGKSQVQNAKVTKVGRNEFRQLRPPHGDGPNCRIVIRPTDLQFRQIFSAPTISPRRPRKGIRGPRPHQGVSHGRGAGACLAGGRLGAPRGRVRRAAGALARAVAKQPDVLLCDEPTGALDVRTGILVLDAIQRINDDLGTTTAVITHNAIIAEMADRVIHVSDGQIASVETNGTKRRAEELKW